MSWSPPRYRTIVTGYHISYQDQDGGHRGSVMTGETNHTATITGLIAGATYSISVAANSSTLSSTATRITFNLRKFSQLRCPLNLHNSYARVTVVVLCVCLYIRLFPNMQMIWSSPRAVFAHFRDQQELLEGRLVGRMLLQRLAAGATGVKQARSG